MKRITALVLALIMCLSFTACGGDDSSNGGSNTLTVTDVVKGGRTALDGITSLSADMNVEMSISADGMSMGAAITASATVDMKNQVAGIKMDMNSNGLDQNIEMYVENGNPPSCYMNLNGSWYKVNQPNSSQFNTTTIYVDDNIRFYYDAIEKSKNAKVSRVSFDGKDCYLLESSIRIDSAETAAALNVDSMFSQHAGSKEIMNTVMDALGEVEIKLYIDCETNLPCGFEVDMKDALNNLYAELVPGVEITVDKARSSARYYDFNTATVTIPDEARDAQSISYN